MEWELRALGMSSTRFRSRKRRISPVMRAEASRTARMINMAPFPVTPQSRQRLRPFEMCRDACDQAARQPVSYLRTCDGLRCAGDLPKPLHKLGDSGLQSSARLISQDTACFADVGVGLADIAGLFGLMLHASFHAERLLECGHHLQQVYRPAAAQVDELVRRG